MKRWAMLVVLISLLALGACDSGSDDAPNSDARPGAAALGDDDPPSSGDPPDPHYAVFPTGVPGTGWELAEAVRQVGSDRDVLGGLPGVDWYAEFEGPEVGDTNAYLSLTGYAQSLEERRAESVSSTASVTEGDINGRKAFWSVEPEDPDSGATVTWEITPDYSLELFATGVELDELLAMARTVEDATEAEWVAVGGVLSDCSAGEADCPDSAAG